MSITKQSIQQKIDTFEAQKQQLLANTNAVEGALQMLRMMLQELSEPDPVEPVKD